MTTTDLTCIGVLAHPLRSRTFPVAQRIVDNLRENGINTWVHKEWVEADVVENVSCADMVIAIGGDGAMLRAARVCAPFKIPVLGLNMGQLGFLTEINSPDDWENCLERLLKGDYWIEDRMMLRASVLHNDEVLVSGDALNDVVISGNIFGKMIKLDCYIDEHWTTTYNADALVIATATGSTAYTLALGGPILPPELHNILIVPAAPHLSMDRPIVISEGSRVEVKASSNNRSEIILSVDGVVLKHIKKADRVFVQASEHKSRFVRFRGRNYFYRSLLDRLEPRSQRAKNDE